jgi:voltage-gated potassium channel
MWYAKVFNYVLLAVILGNAVAFIIATVPTVGHETAFYTIELVTSCLFLVEYALRIVVVPEDPRNIGLSPTRARLRYVVTLRALIDAAATFPFFIELAIGYELPTLTWLRLLRCFRILKTEKATRALSSIYRVIWCVESYWCR